MEDRITKPEAGPSSVPHRAACFQKAARERMMENGRYPKPCLGRSTQPICLYGLSWPGKTCSPCAHSHGSTLARPAYQNLRLGGKSFNWASARLASLECCPLAELFSADPLPSSGSSSAGCCTVPVPTTVLFLVRCLQVGRSLSHRRCGENPMPLLSVPPKPYEQPLKPIEFHTNCITRDKICIPTHETRG